MDVATNDHLDRRVRDTSLPGSRRRCRDARALVPHNRPMTRRGRSPGSAGGGGYEFQSAVTAYVAAHILAGVGLNWLERDEGVPDIPSSLAAETLGPGDDLAVELFDGFGCELQAKAGLRNDARFVQAIDRFAPALAANEAAVAILAVDARSSSAITKDLAHDLGKIQQGRNDVRYAVTDRLLERCAAWGNPLDIAARLRLVTLDLANRSSAM